MPAPQYVPPALPVTPRVVGTADQITMHSDAARPAVVPEATGTVRVPGVSASPAPMAPPSVRLSWPITSIVETCRRLDINLRDYLSDVLPRLGDWPARRAGELTSTAWKVTQAKKI